MRRSTSTLSMFAIAAFAIVTPSVSGSEDLRRVMRSERSACDDFGCWPDTWVIGCQKCGSTALAVALRVHLDVCGAELTGINQNKSAYFKKEPHYWDRVAGTGVPIRTSDFTALFPSDKEGCAGFMDATPNYLLNENIPVLLGEAMPLAAKDFARFIVVLREPIARDLSSYNHQRYDGTDWQWGCPATQLAYDDYVNCQVDIYKDIVEQGDRPIREVLDDIARIMQLTIWGSLYVVHIDAWMSQFARSQILVLQFDDFFAEGSVADLSTLRSFLKIPLTGNEIEKAQAIPKANVKANSGKVTSLKCQTRARFQKEVFNDWNSKLYAHLKYDRESGLAPSEEPSFSPFREDAAACT